MCKTICSESNHILFTNLVISTAKKNHVIIFFNIALMFALYFKW